MVSVESISGHVRFIFWHSHTEEGREKGHIFRCYPQSNMKHLGKPHGSLKPLKNFRNRTYNLSSPTIERVLLPWKDMAPGTRSSTLDMLYLSLH